MHWGELAGRVLPILGFLVCITVVADLADRIGVFEVIAHAAARAARGSVLVLWLLVVAVAVASTAVLSIDTTAVLLTPVVLALATQLGLDKALFAYTAVWLANAASLWLPVSNLTNLLALGVLPPEHVSGFFALLWPAASVCTLGTVAVLALLFRRSLRGRYQRAERQPVRHRGLFVLALLVCCALGPAFAAGADPLAASSVAAAVLVIGCVVACRDALGWYLLPWKLVVGVSVLFVVVQVAHDRGLTDLLAPLAAGGRSLGALLALGGVAAVAANAVDNLPAYLAVEPAAGSPIRVAALLVGVNAGALVTPWASLATLLWATRCRAAGVEVSWRRFAWRGLLLTVVLVPAAVTALWLRG